jgi:mono/diheme cytochrome c family protein
MPRYLLLSYSLGALILVLQASVGCRGYTSKDPPIHLNPNMDTQPKGKAYRADDFFTDGSSMRPQVEGTIASGHLISDPHFELGLVDNEPARSLPKELKIDETFLARGQHMYNRMCAACHSHVGDGDGLVGRRLMVKPTSFHSEYMYGLPPGHYFNAITNGIRTMPAYGKMLKPIDRWAVVTYVRSLQMSQDMNGEWIKRSLSWWKQR